MAYKLKSNVKSLCNNSALPNLKSGGKMISSDKGSSNYMKEDTGSAILQGGRKRVGKKVGGSVGSAGTSTPVEPLSAEEKAFFNTSNLPTKTERLAKEAKENNTGPASTVKSRKKVKTKKEVVKKQAPKSDTKKDNTPPAVTGSDAVRLAKIKANKKNKSAAPEALTGSDAVKVAKIKEKKKGKEMSRGEIREAKKKDKDSGMSRKEVRLNKTKRKAASTRAKTVSKETAAKGGKEAQRLARKTIRLEKKAAKIEGRVKASKIK
jgi:hypothetical protein